MSEMELVCRFCGINAVSTDELASVLDRPGDEYSDELSLRQKIVACLPVNVSHDIIDINDKSHLTN